MPIERVHARKGLLTPFTGVRADVQMKRFVTLAIMLTCETFLTSRPFAFERTFFIVRPDVAPQVELTCEGASAAFYRASECGLGSSPVRGGSLGGWSGNELPLNLGSGYR
jgi:hypothetical protein